MIFCVCLNPALQKIIVFKNFKINSVNRAEKLYQIASGKGINVARTLKLLGEDVVVFCLLGGVSGDFIKSNLKEEGIKLNFVEIEENTRTCITLLNNLPASPFNKVDNNPPCIPPLVKGDKGGFKEQTELIEPSPVVSKSEAERILTQFNSLIPKAEILTLSGTVPDGIPDDIYLRMIESANHYNIPVIADISGKSLKLALQTVEDPSGSKNKEIYMIKPNLVEFASTYNLVPSSTPSPLSGEDKVRGNLEKKVRTLFKSKPFIAVFTNGSKDFFAFTNENSYIVAPPKVNSLNAIGSGDSMSAGFAYCLKRNIPFEESLKFATACGTSNATTLLPGVIVKEQVEKLKQKVKITVKKL